MSSRKSLIIFLLVIAFLQYLAPSTVKALFSQSYQDYIFQYNKYRDTYQEYQVSKGKYLNFKTLTSQIEAQNKTKAALIARTDTLSSYLTAVNDKLIETKGVNPTNLNTSSTAIQLQQSVLNKNKMKAAGAATINDLGNINEEFKTSFPEISDLSNQVLGTIAMSKLNYFFQKYDSEQKQLADFVKTAQAQGLNTENWERQIQTADGKRALAQDKYSKAELNFYPKETSDRLDITAGNTNLKDSFQYIKDAISFLLETEKSVRGE